MKPNSEVSLLEPDPLFARRNRVNHLFSWACVGAVALSLLPLGSLLYALVLRGIGGISLDLFTKLPAPVGEAGGGMANAVVGTLQLVGLASAIGIPIALAAAVFLSEYGGSKLAIGVRFAADVLSGVPSITIGLFVYGIVVIPMKRFSMLAGAIALAILMLPTVTRTAEELLRLVPNHLREAGLGLGVSRWRTTLSIVMRTALPGIITGVSLAVARIAGETAPLLFTAFNNSHWAEYLDDPVASLPVQIYTYAVSPYDEWHRQAWAAALSLVTIILALSIVARLATKNRVH